MTTIATMAVKLIADAAGFISTMSQAEQKTQTWSQSVSSNLKSIGGDITNVGSKATGYLTLPLIAAGTAAVNYASDLQETKSKASVIFGEMTDDLMAWSSTSATALGQSQRQALDGASNFAIFGKAANLADTDLLNFAKTNTELASDLASFFNTSPEEAINALGAAYRGESEPIRKYGVLLNEAALQQQALEMGLISQLGPLTQQQRILAAHELIMKQTAVAQGDFARTADGVANQTRIMRAQFEDAAATLGNQLLPYATQLIQWISQAITWFQALSPEQQKWVVGFLAIVAVAGPLLVVIGSLISAVGAIIGVIGAITTPILIVIAVIAALIAIGYLLYQAWINNWGGIQEKTAAVIAFVQGVIQAGLQFIEDLTTGKLGAVSEIWNNTFTFIQTYIQNFITFWKAIFAAFAAAANGDWYAFGENMRVAFDTMLKTIGALIQTSWANIKTAVSALVTNVIEFFKTTNWADVGTNIVKGIANGITAAVGFIKTAAQNAAKAALDAAKGFLGIKSPSTKFKAEVGWQMAAGAALGWEQGLKSLFPDIMPAAPALAQSPASGGTAGVLNIGPIQITIQGNADESNVRRGVTLGIGDALRASGKA